MWSLCLAKPPASIWLRVGKCCLWCCNEDISGFYLKKGVSGALVPKLQWSERNRSWSRNRGKLSISVSINFWLVTHSLLMTREFKSHLTTWKYCTFYCKVWSLSGVQWPPKKKKVHVKAICGQNNCGAEGGAWSELFVALLNIRW